MKKIIITILLIAGGFTVSMAQSMLKVTTADGRRINVSVDGRYFNKTGTSVTVGDLPGGKHYLQVYTMGETRRGRGFEQLLFEGKVKTFEGMITLFVYNADSGNDIETQDMNSYLAAHPIPNANNGQNNNYNNNAYNNNAPTASPVNSGTLTDAKIDKLKTDVAAKATDTEKMNVLKQGLESEKITTNQVGIMMDWFIFESAKVTFAEWAYNITVDKEYFSDLDSKFTYKNYQDDLDKFIKSKQ